MKAIAGAILINAGCTLMVAGGLADDVAAVPIILGIAYLIADLVSRKPASRTAGDVD